MAWKRKNSPTIYKHSQIVLAVLLFLLLVVIGFIFWIIMNQLDKNTKVDTTVIETNTATQTASESVSEESGPQFDAVVLQQAVDAWVGSVTGTASVVVSDIDNTVLASHNPDQEYFTASIYKLYVAYAGYQQIDSGEVDPNEMYVNGFTRAECLDVMIRDSYSPCAEKLWNELGKDELTTQLETYGIQNTSMTGLTTTAVDASLMLGRIERGEGLSEASRAAFLDSMKDQDALYRRGLPSGFTNSVVYNKVGWNEKVEWHDTAIVELADGRKIIITVLSENVGSAAIAKLGTAIEAAVQE